MQLGIIQPQMGRNVELLAPGGNFEKIKTAINYGADAVYTGYKQFGLRSRAGNLNKEQLIEALDYVHKSNRRLYLTINSYLFDKDLEELIDFLKFLNNYPPDALIVSDLGVLSIINEYTNIPVHISTQANVTNSYAANLLKRFNVERIVLARELTLDDIKLFTSKSSVDVEAFVHGAMCMSYSGRCFLSAYLTQRSANSGDCAQSCRWKYTVIEQKRPDLPMAVEEHKEGTFIFNSYDMCALPILDQIVHAGVKSLKIEGRMKSVYYVAVAVAVYRSALDRILNSKELDEKLSFYLKELRKISHRPYSLGFYKNKPLQYLESSGYERDCSFVGVIEYCKNGRLFIRVRNRITAGRYEIFTKSLKVIAMDIDYLYDMDSNKKSVGNPNEFLYIKSQICVEDLSILRKCES